MRRIGWLSAVVLLAACHALPPPKANGEWEQRMHKLQSLTTWQLDGRAAVALGTQGWQASLDWRQEGAYAELHLAGPLGIGAQVIKQTPTGISLNGAPPSDATLVQLQDRLGFDLPVGKLRFWLLGVPDPAERFDLTRNEQDRAQHLRQSGWEVEYERYGPGAGDVLPARIVMTRDMVRVRIVTDHWEVPP